MKVIHARNVQQALPEALRALLLEGVERDSRNGPVLMFDEPVTTVYEKPAERVLFWAERDANPFFHLVESVWMLAGRNDVETVAHFVARMRSFSDDGKTFHGAYGFRWREHFGFDQLPRIIDALKKDGTDRRQVLSMWDARADLGRQGKDLPCNLQAIFQITARGDLDMTVTNRSNDIIWGAYGANAVHFSYLHEFVARAVGVPQGCYRQVSANFHAYRNVLEQVHGLADFADNPMVPDKFRGQHDPYHRGEVEPFPLMSIPHDKWLEELDMFLECGPVMGITDPFFRRVLAPVVAAHAAFKTGKGDERFTVPLEVLKDCAASDWRRACEEWINRRWKAAQDKARRQRAEDDGVAYE
ncbi:thymidylate synthase [Stenotrophomonas phage vB_SmaS_Bhz59]